MPDPEFRTPEEVAAVCRVSRRAVYDWLREGKLKGYRAGTRWLIKPEDLQVFLGGEVVSTPEPVSEKKPVGSAVTSRAQTQTKRKVRR